MCEKTLRSVVSFSALSIQQKEHYLLKLITFPVLLLVPCVKVTKGAKPAR